MSVMIPAVVCVAFLLALRCVSSASVPEMAVSPPAVTVIEWRGAEAADLWRRGCRGPWCAMALPRLEMGDWIIVCEAHERVSSGAVRVSAQRSQSAESTPVVSVAWTTSTVASRASKPVESLTSTRRANASMLTPIRAASAEELPRQLSAALPWWWARHASDPQFVNPTTLLSKNSAPAQAMLTNDEAEVTPVSVLHLASHLRDRWVCSVPSPAPVPPAVTSRATRRRRRPANRRSVLHPQSQPRGESFGERAAEAVASDELAIFPPSVEGFETVRLELLCADKRLPNLFAAVATTVSSSSVVTSTGDEVLYCAIIFDISTKAAWTAKAGVGILLLAALAFGALIAYLIGSPSRARRIASLRLEKKFDEWDQCATLRKKEGATEWHEDQRDRCALRPPSTRVSVDGVLPPTLRLRARRGAKADDDENGERPRLTSQWEATEFVDDPSRRGGAGLTYPIDGSL